MSSKGRESQKCYAHLSQPGSGDGLFHFDEDWFGKLMRQGKDRTEPPEAVPESPEVSVNTDFPGLNRLAPYAEASEPPFDPVESWGHANAWDAYSVDSNPYGPGMLHQNPDKAARWLKGWLEADAEIKRFEGEETSKDSDWRTRS